MNQTPSQSQAPSDLVTLSVRVSRQTHEGLKEAAASEYRPVAAEMRRLIEERVEAFYRLKEAA